MLRGGPALLELTWELRTHERRGWQRETEVAVSFWQQGAQSSEAEMHGPCAETPWVEPWSTLGESGAQPGGKDTL